MKLCGRGEGQALEFKATLPEQAHSIAKSIAAFASSNDGLLIYGVADDGRFVGLPGAEDANFRDQIHRRVLGAAKEIKPPVQPAIAWAVHDGAIACVVKVEKGVEPLYYANQRPIVRRGPISRPAEPGEVEQVYRERYAVGVGSISMPSTKLIGQRMQKALTLMNARRYEPLTVVDLARAMGFKAPAELDGIVEGHVAPTFAMLDQFCARFAVDKEWLASGRGQPFRSPIERLFLPEQYLTGINDVNPQCVYLVRSTSAVGETFIVVQVDEFKAWCLPDVWHVSGHVGGGGSRDLLSLYDLFRRWRSGTREYSLLGRLVEPSVAEALYNGEAFPGSVEDLPLSHWWDDLTDLEHKWTTPAGLKKSYGKSFVAAQNIVRAMVSDTRPK